MNLEVGGNIKMDNHQKFCENLGNTSFTRLNYDDTDREVREASNWQGGKIWRCSFLSLGIK